MSVSCQKCSAIVFGGHECIRCGHVAQSESPAPGSTAQSAPGSSGPAPAKAQKAGKPAGESDGNRVLLVAGAVIAAVVLVGGALFGLSKMEASANEQEQEDQLAFAEVEPEKVVLDASFCRRPQSITDAPTPTTAGPNAIVNFERPGLQWEKSEDGIFDPPFFGLDRDRFEIDADTEIEAVYAMCLNTVGSGKDRTCRGYEGNAKYVIAGMTHTASVYELATADLVLETEIGSLPTSCPSLIVSGSRGAQEVDRAELAAALSGVAAPAQYTEFHFYDDLNGLSSSWCGNPKALPEVGANAVTSTPFVLGVSGAKLEEHFPNSYFVNYDEFSHIACLDFVPSTEEPLVCEYPQTGSFKVVRGSHVATIVEASTGTVVASAEFEGKAGCPTTVFTTSGWDATRNATAPDEAYVYITDTVATAEPQSEPVDE